MKFLKLRCLTTFVSNPGQSYPLAAIYNLFGPPGALSSVYFCSILIVSTLSVMTIPLPGYVLPFEKPPYFNFIFYKNGLWLGLMLNALDHYIYCLLTGTLPNKLANYGVMLGGAVGGIAAGLWWWCKKRRTND
jgi:hypothetical protein